MTGALLYFDSAVWLSFVLEDIHLEKAKAQLDRLEKGDRAIVSYLVMLEVIQVLRSRIAKNEKIEETPPHLKQTIQTKILGKIREFLYMLKRLYLKKKIIIPTQDIALSDYLKQVFLIYRSVAGTVKLSGLGYKYQELGFQDIQHAMNAHEFNVDELVTFDEAFKDLHNLDPFRGLKTTIPKNDP